MNELSLLAACEIIKKSGRALILGHVNPDGDCLGSAFALSEIIGMCGGHADVGCDGKVPERLGFMCGEVLSPDKVITNCYDTIISVDVASPGQLGDFAPLIPDVRLMIDHHGSGEAFADNLIDSSASAAGEIIYRIYAQLLQDNAIVPNTRVLRLIYAAIISDSGSFKFSNTTAYTHGIAAELTAAINRSSDGGLSTSDICRLMFGRFTVREMTAKMLAIQNMRFYEDGRLALVVLSSDVLDANGLDESDIGGVIETPRCIDGVLVALSIRQTGGKTYKISSRANADIDCASVCALFGGGGHTRAAGCTVTADSPEDAEKIAVDAFGKALREYLTTAHETAQRI